MSRRLFLNFHPLAKEAFIKAKNSTDWSSIKAKDRTIYSWIGECGHTSKTYAGHWVSAGCLICKNIQLLSNFNDLATKFPHLIESWDEIKNKLLASEVRFNSLEKYYWLCSLKHSWPATISKRAGDSNGMKGTACPYCIKGKYNTIGRVLTGFNDLETMKPEIAKMWNYEKNKLTPSEIYYSSAKAYHWQCENKHTWKLSPAGVIKAKFKCKYCSDLSVWPGYNDLKTKSQRLSKEWDYDINVASPDQYLFKTNKSVKWICSLGHKWADTISHRWAGRNCPYCSSHRILAGFNDLLHLNPTLSKEWHPTKNSGLLPSEITAYSNKIVWWRCTKGHEWKQSVGNRNYGRDCKECSKKNGPSKVEKDFVNKFSSKIKYTLITNSRKIIAPLELDIYIPELNLGIEFNGSYWHDEIKRPESRKKHDHKELLCTRANIRLIIVWEDDWYKDSEKVLEDLQKMMETGATIEGYD